MTKTFQVPSMPMPKLKSLDLSYNNLATVATDITANLTRLRSLDLSYNDLTNVPVVSKYYFSCTLDLSPYTLWILKLEILI